MKSTVNFESAASAASRPEPGRPGAGPAFRNGYSPLTPHHRSLGTGMRQASLPPQVVANALRDPVLGDLLPVGAGFGQATSTPNHTEFADQVLLLYCIQGHGWCQFQARKHEVGSGSLAVIPQGVSYTIGPDDTQSWTIGWVLAAGTRLQAFLTELGVTPQNPVACPGEHPRLTALFEEVLEALEGSSTRPRLWYAAQTLGHLLGTLIWRCSTHGPGEPDLRRRIEQSIDYMRQHLAKPLHVASLAALVNISPSYYAILFKRHTSTAPIDYFIRLRMEHARHLLEETSFHVKQIAVAVGYDDPFYFSRVFKSVTQLAPTDYREQHRRAAANALLNGQPPGAAGIGASAVRLG